MMKNIHYIERCSENYLKKLGWKRSGYLQVDKDGQCSFKTSRLYQEYLLALY